MVNSARYRSDSLTSLSTPLSLSVSSRNSAYISPRGTRIGIQGGRNGFNSGVFRFAESETARRKIILEEDRYWEREKKKKKRNDTSFPLNREQMKFNSSPFQKTQEEMKTLGILEGKSIFTIHPSIHPSCKNAPVFSAFSPLQWHQSVAKDSLHLVISSHDIYPPIGGMDREKSLESLRVPSFHYARR